MTTGRPSLARCLVSLVMVVMTPVQAGAVPASPSQPSDLPQLVISLAPGGLDSSGDPTWVDVTARISGIDWRLEQPFLRIPVKFAGVEAVAYTTEAIDVRDAGGRVPLVASVDDPDAGGFLYFRRWSPARDVGRDVTLHYRAPIRLLIPKLGAGPPFDLRADGGGFSAAGNNFLVVPDTDRPFQIQIDWQLEALDDDAIGVSSFGEGAVRFVGVTDQLTASYFMAGPLGRYPVHGRDAGFSGYWIGSPRFDPQALLAWAEQAYRVIAGFFEDTAPPPFRVLMRGNPYEGGGGAALINSFLVSYPDSKTDADSLRETIAHETVHNWVSSIDGPPGTTSWFSEGMTVAYTRRILLRSGLFTPTEFLDSVNETALSYYTNPLNDLPNDEIARDFWADSRVRTLPYTRGSLYFAALDAALRDHSRGAHSLDNLLKAFLARKGRGEALTVQAWRDLVAADLGDAGLVMLDAMLRGELVVPPADAFGPCYTREEVGLRRFDLGFDRSSLVTEPRIVTGLDPESSAARAGLRNGDSILHPVVLEKAQSRPDTTLQLQVRRADEQLEVEYLPRGDAVDGYRWVRAADVPDTMCGEWSVGSRVH